MRKTILGILFLILYFGVSAAIYFVNAGRTNLPLAWAYFGINLGTGVIFSIVLEIVNPGLIAERFKPGPGRAGSSLQDCQQHPDGSDAGCGGVRCGPVPLERPGRPVAADRRTGLGVSGIFVHGVGHDGQPVLLFSGAVADRPRSGGGRLRAVPIRTSSGYTGAIPYLAFGGLALGSWLAILIERFQRAVSMGFCDVSSDKI